MPWCEPCSRFFNPATLTAEGACPTCGAQIGPPRKLNRKGRARTPWHFWVLVACAGLYLGWRLVQGVIWLVGLLF